MRKVFLLPHARFNMHFWLILDEAVVAHQAKDEVCVVYCDGSLEYCRTNICASKIVCSVCRALAKKAVKALPKEIKVYPLGQFVSSQNKKEVQNLKFDYHSIDELKAIEYRGVDIGYSVLSFYVDLKRNLYPDFNEVTVAFFDQLLRVAAHLTHAVEVIDDVIKPDQYAVFNGRLFDARPFFRKPCLMGRRAQCFEVESMPPTWEFLSVHYTNSLPHDVLANSEKIVSYWNECAQNMPRQKMMQIGESFFEGRRMKAPISSKTESFVALQVANKMPEGWDSTKRNFVFFNSSEDEFAGIDKVFDSFKYKPTQREVVEIIATLASQVDPSIHIYLRLHPNLKNVKHQYHLELLNLGAQFQNVTVVPADSVVSTYALIDAAEKIITVGSTVGVEAVYSKKPSILLGPSYYQLLNICYMPKEDDELQGMLKDVLAPKEPLAAIQYGFYWTSDKGRKWERFDFGSSGRIRFLGIRIPASPLFKLFGSMRLFGLMYKLFVEQVLFLPYQLKRSAFRQIGISSS
jgi:hypothetical protein